VRAFARDALLDLGEKAHPAAPVVLEWLARSTDEGTWLDGLRILGKMKERTPEARDLLVRKGLTHPRTKVREASLSLLVQPGLEVVQRLKGDAVELVPGVVALLKSRDDRLRLQAFRPSRRSASRRRR
jgi:hypothetical protein